MGIPIALEWNKIEAYPNPWIPCTIVDELPTVPQISDEFCTARAN